MSDVDTVTEPKTELDLYFERIKKAEARFTTLVTWHTEVYMAVKNDELIGGSVDSTYVNVTQYEGRPSYPDEGWNEPLVMDVDATLSLLAKITRFARSKGYKVEKDYDTHDFNVRVNLDPDVYGMRVTYYCKRDAVCTPKVVGKKVIPAQPAQPPRVEDVVEWECSKVALLSIPDEDTE